MNSAYLSAAFALGSILLCAQALAEDDYTITYTYGDLASPEKVDALFDRIQKVARRHCPTYAVTHDVSARPQCVAEVMRDLVHSVNHPDLTRRASGDDLRLQVVTTD
jgi:UrcA family protein